MSTSLPRPHRYGPLVLTLNLLAILLASQPVAAAWSFAPLNWLAPVLEAPPYDSLLFGGGALGLLSLLALFAYFRNLDRFAVRRSKALVFLNVMGPGLYLAAALVAQEFAESHEFGLKSQLSGLLIVVPPLLILGLEGAARRVALRLGLGAHGRGWRATAIRQLGLALAIAPDQPDIRRLCALDYADEDECLPALKMFEALGPLESMQDETVLRAMERCYRAQGDIERALACLGRVREISSEGPTLDRRILEDLVRLERREEALAMLEGGVLKPTMDLLLLQQRLYLELNDFDKALVQVERIAEQEGPPFAQSLRLYKDLYARLPENLAVKTGLGRLLLREPSMQQRQQGAAMLEEIQMKEPPRAAILADLLRFYEENNLPMKVREQLYRLVDADLGDPEHYLRYAQILQDENKLDEAMRVLERLTQRLPGDWRGHLRLARLGFNRGDEALARAGVERAEKAAEAAGTAEEAAGLIKHLRHDLAQRRRESEVTQIAERLRAEDGAGASVEQRLALIEQLIGVDRFDQALSECDELLGAQPEQRPAVEAIVRQGIEHSERNFRLRDFLADLLFEQGRYDETLEEVRAMAEQSLLPAQVMADGCRKILGRAPQFVEARRELALAEREGKRWEEITAALDPVLDSPKLTDEDRALWVEAAFRTGRLEDAARIGLPLADALAAETGFMIMLVDILLGAQRFDDAVDVYQKARAAMPESERLVRMERKVFNARRAAHMTQLEQKATAAQGLSAEEHLHKAELHYEAGETDEAIIHFQRAADDPRLHKLALAKMAVVLCERGMYDLAEETLDPLELTRESVQEHPELKEMIYQIGRVMEKIRKPELAAKYYKRIFRVDAAYNDVVQRLERLS